MSSQDFARRNAHPCTYCNSQNNPNPESDAGAEPAWAAGAQFPSHMGRSGMLQEPSTASPALPKSRPGRVSCSPQCPGSPLWLIPPHPSLPTGKWESVEAAFLQSSPELCRELCCLLPQDLLMASSDTEFSHFK